MLINLSPIFEGERITVSTAGDVVTINGVNFDFTPLEIGGSIPATAVDPSRFVGEISRDSAGNLVMYLLYGHALDASEEARYPLPITTAGDGPVELPDPESPPPDLNPEPEPDPAPEPEGETT
jgi:hypothetical protein